MKSNVKAVFGRELHSMLLIGSLQAGVADITAALRSYRPSQTVLEAEVAAPRRGTGAGTSPAPVSAANGSRANVMQLKRKRHDNAILV